MTDLGESRPSVTDRRPSTAVHGHGGATEIVFTDGDPAPLDPQAIKVAVCEYLLSLNEGCDIPFVPPTAIDWMGNGLTDAVRKVASLTRQEALSTAGDPPHNDGQTP